MAEHNWVTKTNVSPRNKWSELGIPGPYNWVQVTFFFAHFVPATFLRHTSTYSSPSSTAINSQGTVPLLSAVAKCPGIASIEPKRRNSSLLQYALAKSCQMEKVVINNCGDISVIPVIPYFSWLLSKKNLLFWTNSKNI